MNDALSPEIHIVLQCARSRFDNEEAKQLRTLIRKEIDWRYVLQLALAHRVVPIAYSALNSACADAVPAPIMQRLRDYFYVNVGRNLFLTPKLVELLQAFDSHGIPAIPYKGLTLAALIYRDLALRQIGDLDVLVRQRDYEKAQQVLTTKHFRRTIEHEWEAEFTDEGGTVAVDLHRSMVPRDFFCPLGFEYLWKRLQPVAVAGRVVRSLCPEDTLLMLSLQIAKDGHPQLVKICDIAELIRAYPGLNWTAALQSAKKIGGRKLMLFGMAVAGNVLGISIPREAAHLLKFAPRMYPLVEHACGRIFRSSSTAPERLESQPCHWLLHERLRDKLYSYHLRYVRGMIVPCEPDRRFLPLPARLYFLYWFFRPIRLIAKYGAVLLRRMWVSLVLMSPGRVKAGARHD